MSKDDENTSVFNMGLGRNKALDEQVEHPGQNPFRNLPKRFYKAATAAPLGEGFTVLLDGKSVKTPAKSPLVVPTLKLAEAMAEEWGGQGERIDPRTMWLTKLANTVIDRITPRRDAVVDELAAFSGTDLICYMADHPIGLAQRQAAHWAPLIVWAEEELGASLRVTPGFMHVAQDEAALVALRTAIEAATDFELAGLHNAVTLTGSTVIGLALMRGRLTVQQAFDAAHVDEAWQVYLSGEDEDEAARLATRLEELEDTAKFLALTRQ
ncbi:MAG: ATP12 family protein [Parvibaculum sp.]|nr:ATP12 family protein [Parvibaculum sp.]